MTRLVTVAAALALAGCAATTAAEPVPPQLVGPEWVAQRIGVAPVVAGSRPTARFDAGGRVAGSTGCNRYFAPYRVEAATLVIGPIAGTKMACAEPLMAQEARFERLLAGQHPFVIRDGTLVIGSGRDSLRFSAEPAP